MDIIARGMAANNTAQLANLANTLNAAKTSTSKATTYADVGARIEAIEADVQVASRTVDIYNTAGIFTAGKGKNSAGTDVDNSASLISNGQFSAEIRGNSVSVLVGVNFASDIGGFTGMNGTLINENNEGKFTVSSLSNSTRVEKSLNYNVGDRFYIRFKIKPKYANDTFMTFGGVEFAHSTPVANQYNTISTLVTAINNTAPFRLYHKTDTNYAIGDIVYFDDIMIINLTQNNLASLTQSECDTRFNFMTSGSKSTISEIRMMTVKNLFDKTKANVRDGYYINDVGAEIANSGSYYTRGFYKVFPNQYLTVSGTGVQRIYWFDKNKAFISRSTTTTGLSPSNAMYADIQLTSGYNLDTIQLEYGSVATSYTNHDFSEMFYSANDSSGNVLEMHRVPNGTADRYKEVSGQIVFEQNNLKKILQASDITELSNGTNVQTVKITTAGKIVGVAGCVNFKSYGNTAFPYDAAGNTYKVYDLIADYIRVTYPLGTFADLAAAQAALVGSSLIYQLFTSVITPAEVRGGLDCFGANTTIIQEAYHHTPLVYSTVDGGLVFPYSIQQIDKIEKIVDGVMTAITFTPTIAASGLTALIAELADGDVVTVYAPYKTENGTLATTIHNASLDRADAQDRNIVTVNNLVANVSNMDNFVLAMYIEFDHRLALLEGV